LIVGSLIFMLAEFILLVSGWGSRPNSLLYISIGTGLIAATLLVLGFLQERKRQPRADKGAQGSTGPTETLAFEDQVEADLKALEEGSDDVEAGSGGIRDEPVVSKAGLSSQWSGIAAGTGGTMLKSTSQDANEGEKVKSETMPVPTESNSAEPAAKEKKRGFGRFFGRSGKGAASTAPQDAAAALDSGHHETKPFPGVKLDGEPVVTPGEIGDPQPSPAPVISRAKSPAKPKPKPAAKPKTTVKPQPAAKPKTTAKPKPAVKPKPKPSAPPRPAAKPSPKPKSPAKPKAAGKSKAKPAKK